MNDVTSMTQSRVEQTVLKSSIFPILYPPIEKIKSLILDNFPALGKITALRFLEWVQQNPGGVISLPTGKTPEHFILWVKTDSRYLGNSLYAGFAQSIWAESSNQTGYEKFVLCANR